jgi:hypothetical protein
MRATAAGIAPATAKRTSSAPLLPPCSSRRPELVAAAAAGVWN